MRLVEIRTTSEDHVNWKRGEIDTNRAAVERGREGTRESGREE